MKYKEWTGELEGSLPDIGAVGKGRVLLIDTDGKEAALEGHAANLKDLGAEEGEKRYQRQLRADAKAQLIEVDEALPVVTAAPPSEPPAETSVVESRTEAPNPKGGKK